jgi:hypothetical protein
MTHLCSRKVDQARITSGGGARAKVGPGARAPAEHPSAVAKGDTEKPPKDGLNRVVRSGCGEGGRPRPVNRRDSWNCSPRQPTAKAATPFLLAEMAKRTGGKSLKANLALLSNNARFAGELAVALARG